MAAGARDDAGRFVGGTELRVLTTHGGKLYAGNGYWGDRPGREGAQNAQILVLDGPKAQWRVDHAFDEFMVGGPRHIAVAALSTVEFTTDGSGAQLAAPVSMLLASTWDRAGTTRVFSRDDQTGRWTATTLAEDRPAADFLPQIRSFAVHRDRVTGSDLVFAGQSPRGVFSGRYDATDPGSIRWGSTPELGVARLPTTAFSGLEDRLRVSSFAECDGRIYAAVGQQIYERIDGPDPQWRLVYTNPRPGHSETGLRGLTAIPDPSGRGEMLLAAVEGNAARLVRIDPANGSEITELDIEDFLGKAWHSRVGYAIAAYNDMTRIADPQQGDLLLIGLEVFIPPGAPIPSGHGVVDVGYGRLDSAAWYLVRHADGHYGLHRIDAELPGIGHSLVATRSIRLSPFAGDTATLYFAGYDANKAAAHNTAWIVRTSVGAAIREADRP